MRTSHAWIQPYKTFDSKVKIFFIMIVFDKFDELMLPHDVFLLLFLEIHTWIKRVLNTHERHGELKKLIDYRPIPYIFNVLHQATTSLLVHEKKESKSNTFWMLDSDCRTQPNCNGCHDFIRTPIGAFLDFTESLSSLLSNGSRLSSIFFRSCPGHRFRSWIFSIQVLRHLILAQSDVYRVWIH
jgi:hypothetical protein